MLSKIPFTVRVDWYDLDSVKRYAKSFDQGHHVVFRVRGRENYNITHLSRTDRWNTPETEEIALIT